MSAYRVNIECRECEDSYLHGGPDSWAFDNVPMNDTTRAIVAKHERRYGHHVRIRPASFEAESDR